MIKRKLALMLAIGIAATPVITTAVEANAQELKSVTVSEKTSPPDPGPGPGPGPEVTNTAPVITTPDSVVLELGEKFDPLKGVTVTDEEDGKTIMRALKIKHQVNTNKVGSYNVTYEVTDKGGKTTTKTIKVLVRIPENNTAPTIMANDVTIKMGENFDPLKYVDVNDKEDGKEVRKNLKVIENTVDTKKPGVYKVVYKVVDKAGATAIKEIKVTVVGLVNTNNTAPVIEAEDVKIELNSNFDPLKYVKATDKEDGTAIMKSLEVIENKVNTNKVGTYNVTYKVTDKDRATATKTIKVVVTIPSDKNTAPIIIAEDVNLKIGDEFNPLNHVNAFDKEDGAAVIKSLEVVANTVDTSKAGIYTVIYRVTDKDGEVTNKKINVTVGEKDNTAPMIFAEDVNLKVGDEFNPLNHVTAMDKEDGKAVIKSLEVVANTVDTSKSGIYTVIYRVTDKDGEVATKKINVTVNDKMVEMNNAPTIDAKDLELKVGDKFDPLNHVTAFDKEDGKAVMKGLKVLENTVDTSKAGTYKVVYEVTDKDGAKATKEIKVTVKENNNGNDNNGNGNNNNGNNNNNNNNNGNNNNGNNNNNNNGNTSTKPTKPTKPNTNLPQTGAAGVGLLGMGIISTLAGLFVSKKKKK